MSKAARDARKKRRKNVIRPVKMSALELELSQHLHKLQQEIAQSIVIRGKYELL